MILLDGDVVKIGGDPFDILLELVNLKIAIAHDPNLMEIDKDAMEAAVNALKNNTFEIEGLRRTKYAGEEKVEEIKKKGSN